MSCFRPSPDHSNPISQTVNANGPNVNYTGGWSLTKDSQQQQSEVSQAAGDTAVFVFRGTSIQVFGKLEIAGKFESAALFAITDLESNPNGGTTCQGPLQEGNLLFDTSPLQLGLHTLLVTNKGGTLSLQSLEVFGGSETSTSSSTQKPNALSSTPTLTTFPTSPFLQPPQSHFPPSQDSSHVLETSLSSTTLALPLPHSSSGPSESSVSNLSQISTDSAKTSKSYATSYTTSDYTEFSVVSGSTTTIVIQTIVEIQQPQIYHGPSRGAVAGAAVGSLLFLFLLIGLGLWWWRRRRNRVRFMYGISNLDFDHDMMTRSSAEIRSCGPGVRDSDATLYGDILPTYKEPASYSSLALDLKKHRHSEYTASGVAGDRRLTALAEPNTRSTSERSLCDSPSVPGEESGESVVPPSKEGFEAL